MWKPIKEFDQPDGELVDVWMAWGASALTMGMADSFKLDGGAWRKGGKWYHHYRGGEAELQSEYVRYWAPFGEGPENEDPVEAERDAREYERLKEKFGP